MSDFWTLAVGTIVVSMLAVGICLLFQHFEEWWKYRSSYRENS